MKITDYAPIAVNYDRNPLRRLIPRDPLLEGLAEGATVLDLACGTGNYLQSQGEFFPHLRWMGIDLSPAMLEQARAKNLNAELIHSSAEALPLPEASVDFVKVRFAHHHFVSKKQAFAEVKRVLKPGGRVSVFNICHEYSKRSWVYEYFPAAAVLDQERFPTTFEFYQLLADLGFSVECEVSVKVTNHRYADLVTEARNRDMSQLALLEEKDYQAGLAALEKASRRAVSFVGDVALVNFVATKT